MSDKTELAGLPVADLAELTRGFYFLFWGVLVFVLALLETLVRSVGQPFSVLLLIVGGLGSLGGAYRLAQVHSLGPVWRMWTRNLLVVTGAVDYLSLFFLMWRQLPANGYLLVHALVFFEMVIVLFGLLCPPVWQLTRAAGRPQLAGQCVWFGVTGGILLVPAGLLIARLLVAATQQGRDPLGVLQLWLVSVPHWLTLGLLLPVALLLSLLWTAKDLALEALRAKPVPASQ